MAPLLYLRSHAVRDSSSQRCGRIFQCRRPPLSANEHAIEALTIGVMSANAAYGTTYTSPAPPLFSQPFVTAATGQTLGQAFPVTLAPLNSSASRPDITVDWSQFEPITGLPNYLTTNRIPYTEGIHALARARIRRRHRLERELRRHTSPSHACHHRI